MTINKNSSRDEVIEALKTNGMDLQHASDAFKKDLDIIKIAVNQNPQAISFISENTPIYIIVELIETYPDSFEFLPNKHKANELLVSHLVTTKPELFKFLLDKHKNSRKFLSPIIVLEPKVLKHLPESLKLNKIFILKILRDSNPSLGIENLPENFRSDKEMVLLAFKFADYKNISLIDQSLLFDLEFVIKLINICNAPDLNDHIRKLWNEKNLNTTELDDLFKISRNPELIKTNAKKDDIDFLRKVLKVNPIVFSHLSAELQANTELQALSLNEEAALEMIKKDLTNFSLLREELRLNPNFALKALKISRKIFRQIDEKLKNDEQNFFLPALKLHPKLVTKLPQYTSDKELFKKALRANPDVFYEKIPQELKANKDVSYCLLRQNPNLYFSHTYHSFSNDKEAVERVFGKIPQTRKVIDEELKKEDLSLDKLSIAPDAKLHEQFYDAEDKLKLEELKAAITTAQKAYKAWYDSSAEKEYLNEEGFDRTKPGRSFSIFKDHKLTWFRHGSRGQSNVETLVAKISNLDEIAIWGELYKFLKSSGRRYHVHSFASFLVDELQKIKSCPLAEIETKADTNRYDKKEVVAALSIYTPYKGEKLEAGVKLNP